MKRLILLTLFFLLLGVSHAHAQVVAQGAPGDTPWLVNCSIGCSSASDTVVTGTITSITCPGTGCVTLTQQGAASIFIHIDGTFTGINFQFSASTDGTNFFNAFVTDMNGDDNSVANAGGDWVITGFRAVRVAAVSYTSGTANISFRGSANVFRQHPPTYTQLLTISTTLSSIDSKLPALVSGRIPVDPSGVTSPVSQNTTPWIVGPGRATATGTITSATPIDLDVTGYQSLSIQMSTTGGSTGSWAPRYSIDGTAPSGFIEVWGPYNGGTMPLRPTTFVDVSATPSGFFAVPLQPGTSTFRINPAYGSGTWSFTFAKSTFPLNEQKQIATYIAGADSNGGGAGRQVQADSGALRVELMSPQNGSSQADVITQTDAAVQPNYVPYHWSLPMLYNGATWDRWRGDTTNGAFVNVKNATIAVTQSGAWTNVGVTGTFWPTTAGTPGSTRLSDGSVFYDARVIRALTSADVVDAIIRGGAKGATAAADVTSTAEGADHQAVDVQNYHGGVAIDPRSIRALTSTDVVTDTQGNAGTNAQAWWTQIGDTANGPAAVKAASTPAVAADKALVVAFSPNSTGVSSGNVNWTDATPITTSFQLTISGMSTAVFTSTLILGVPATGGQILLQVSNDNNTWWQIPIRQQTVSIGSTANLVYTYATNLVEPAYVEADIAGWTFMRVFLNSPFTGGAQTHRITLDARAAPATTIGTITNATALWTQLGDTANGPAAVKAASTPATVNDKALVVAMSPNTTGVSSGSVTWTDATLAGQQFQLGIAGMATAVFTSTLVSGAVTGGVVVIEVSNGGGTYFQIPKERITFSTNSALASSTTLTYGGTTWVEPAFFVADVAGWSFMRVTLNTVFSGGAQSHRLTLDVRAISSFTTGIQSVGGSQANNSAAVAQNPVVTGVEAQSNAQPAAATAGRQRWTVGSLDGVQYARLGGPVYFTCSFNSIAATLTQLTGCAGAGAGLKYYVTDVFIQTTTTTSGTYAFQTGTGANCVTGTTAFFPSSGTANRFNAPITTSSLASMQFMSAIPTAVNVEICVIGVATNTVSGQISGYIAP